MPASLSDERLESGQVVGGRWVLEEKIGTGGFGSVWKAREAGGEPVALKVLHEKNRQSAWVLDRFIRESWNRDEFTLYGRFDLAYNGASPPKMLEYNSDTPTSLLEAAVIQWFWKQDVNPLLDQFNSID